jgi:hypothetical protein
VASYDIRERVWNPPMPLLFQRSIGSENRPFTPTAIRKLLINALAATGLTDAGGDPLMFSPHDFRRIFVADAIMSMLVSDVHCCGLTRRNENGWRRSAIIWWPGLSRPSAKDGSGKSKDYKSA